MPLYEYLCQACGHRFEKIQKFSDPIEDVCPSCGGKVEKLVSSPAIQFKGSGWYITDYAKKTGTSAGSAKGESSSASEKSSDSSSSTGDSAKKTDTPAKPSA
jgi:putative FmdB family regulatory protein